MNSLWPSFLHACLVVALLASVVGCGGDAPTPPARSAVAANFAATAEALRDAHLAAGGDPVDLVIGSTGGLHAQIAAGAPFDAFLAADTARPDRLIAAGLADGNSRFIYAVGRLALWTPRTDLAGDPAVVLRRRNYDHLAIADPVIAPYGAAARAYLERTGLLAAVSPRLVTAQNVAQAYQFAASGNADLALIALAQAAATGSVLVIPDDAYPPLDQGAVLLTDHPTARAFLAFIRHDPDAHAIITAHGYRLPTDEARADAERR